MSSTVGVPLVGGDDGSRYVDLQFADPAFEERSGWPAWHQGGTPLRELEFERCRMPANLVGLGFADCRFKRCVFRGYIRSSEFVRCEFEDCRFDHSAIVSTKLKYCRFRRCTFSDAAIYRCDLYRADFRPGNTFPDAELGLVSLSRSDLGGAGELRRPSFGPFDRDRDPPLGRLAEDDGLEASTAAARAAVRELRPRVGHAFIQEDPGEYETLLRETHLNARLDDALGGRLAETAENWRMLSAVWMAAGAYDDAGWAYRRSRRATRANLAPWRGSAAAARQVPLISSEKGPRRVGLWATLAIAGPLCGFGTRLRGIVLAMLAMVVGFAVLLKLTGALSVVGASGERAANWFDALRFSIGQLATTPPGDLTLPGAGWSLAADVETLLGIALLGLFGFVLANLLRWS
jgi:hypothetical protein